MTSWSSTTMKASFDTMNDWCHHIVWRLWWRGVWLLGIHSLGIWLRSEVGHDFADPRLPIERKALT